MKLSVEYYDFNQIKNQYFLKSIYYIQYTLYGVINVI